MAEIVPDQDLGPGHTKDDPEDEPQERTVHEAAVGQLESRPAVSLDSGPARDRVDDVLEIDIDAQSHTLTPPEATSSKSSTPNDVGEKAEQDHVEAREDDMTRTTTFGPRRLERQHSTASSSPSPHRLHRFQLYETSARFFITGSDVSDKHFKVLKIDRTSGPIQLNLFEDEIVYSKAEINQLLVAIDDGNKATGGLRHRFNFWGLIGFIRFTDTYYMMLITKRQQVAMLGGHYTYQIEATELIPLATGAGARFSQGRNAEESRFLGILNNLDLSKNFYFSHTYNITRTLQENMMQERVAVLGGDRMPVRDYNDMFVWNRHLLKPLVHTVSNVYDWCVPVVHGFIDQSSINVFGRQIYITIIGRRSRFFAGARFLKRGVNDLGHVANDVETEQIVSEMLTTSFHAPGPRLFANPTYTSYVHHRGSIPLYWMQDNSGVTPKPAIDLSFTDPFYQPAALHFNNLFQRYGCPLYVLNLIKARERTPRESKLLHELKNAIDYLNQFLPDDKKIIYEAFDMSRASKTRGGDVIGNLEKLATEILDMTGFFHNGQEDDGAQRVQNGVARTNCIDCLDRTNAAQFVIGKHAFGLQLKALGVISSAEMAYDSDAIDKFTHMFHDHGDTIAVQYGGSHLVNTMATYRKINHWQGHGRDMVESFKRYYHNSFLDSQRQEAHNLFLGNYVYAQGQPMLWDLVTDHYLHHSDPQGFLGRNKTRKSYIHWYDPAFLEPRSLPSLASTSATLTTRLGVVDYDDFWLEYYRPLVLSSFLKVYAYRLTAASLLATDRLARDPTSATYDPSPFVPRIDPSRPQPDSPGKKTHRKEVTIVDPTSEAEVADQAGPHSPQHARDASVVGAGILVHPPTPHTPGQGTRFADRRKSQATTLAALAASADTTANPTKAAKEEKSLWTLNKIFESSLNPSVSTDEAAEYERYVSHPSNIPLVVSSDQDHAVGRYSGGATETTQAGRVALEYASYLASSVSTTALDRPRRATREDSWLSPDHHHHHHHRRQDVAGSAIDLDPNNDDPEQERLRAEFEEFVGVGTREDALKVWEADGDKKRYKAYRQWLVKGKSLFKQSKVDPEYRP